MVEENQKKGLGIASVILGGFAILCCSCMGFGIVFGIIGFIFALICVIKGSGSGKTLGIVGLILNIIGILLGAYVIISILLTVNWDNFSMEALTRAMEAASEIDPNDRYAVEQWMDQYIQPFFTVPLQ